MSEVFISYARSTEAYAKKVANALRAGGFDVWYDDDLPAHRPFSDVLDEKLREAKAVIVIWSSEAAKSLYVRAEANTARETGKLVQLRVDKTELPLPFREIQCVDLAGWSGSVDAAGWRKVIASVEELVGQKSQQPTVIAQSPSRKLSGFLSHPWVVWAPAAAVVLMLAAGGVALLAMRPAYPPKPAATSTESLRVAIIPFDVVGTESDTTRAFADTLLDKIVDTLTANQVETVSRADSLSLRGNGRASTLASLGVGLTLEGSVQSSGNTITVRLHLDDVRAHETLWSKEFEGGADTPEGLQTQVALHATDVTRWAVSPRLKEIRADPSLVAAYLEGEDEQINGGGGRALAIARDLVARAPRLAAAHDLLASTVGQENGLVVVTPEARAESNREARIAIALDGGSAHAFANLSRNMPVLSSFKERERLLLKALALEPGDSDANWEYIFEILAATGRTEDAIAQARAAWQLDPFTVWLAASLPATLANAGRIDEARAAVAQMKQKWPETDTSFRSTEFEVESWTPPFSRALALLDDPDFRSVLEAPPYGKPGATDVYRTVLRARVGPAEGKRTAAQLVEKSIDDGTIVSPFTGISFLSSLGDVDGAFRVADRTLTSEKLRHIFGSDPWYWSGFYQLFGTQTADIRRDRRFMPLAKRLGLVDYWQSTGHWPDFCSEPGLPYDCKVEAAKLKNQGAP